MIYKELLEKLNSLSEEQLSQQVIIFYGDNETAYLEVKVLISDEDIYWERHGDLMGNLKEVEQYYKDNPSDFTLEEELEDLVKVPAGYVTILVEP